MANNSTNPIVIDTNILKNISEGNQPLATALNGYLRSGRKVVIARAAYDELIGGASTPQKAGQYREMLADLNIAIAEPGAAAARQNFMADNIARNPPKNAPGQIKDYGSGNQDPPKPGDVFVAAQAKALDGELWTLDKSLRSRAQVLGVRILKPDVPSVPGGNDDPNVGRRLLGMNPKIVGADGRVALTTNPSSGGNAGVHAVEGVADNTVPEFVPPSAKGVATIGGIQLGLELLNYVLNKLNDSKQQQRVREAFAQERTAIQSTLASNPESGVLIIFYFMQINAPSESILQPGATFSTLRWGGGLTIDEARRTIASRPDLMEAPGPGRRMFGQEQWIPPAHKSAITKAKCPFPPLAYGRFWVGASTKAKFQLVEFSFVGGFDDVVEKTVDLPTNRNADFVILNPPAQVYWFNQNGRQSMDVPLKDAKSANGSPIKVVDLDPWSPFKAQAAMVFPRTEWTEEYFDLVSSTDGYRALSNYVNFEMVRWIRPENIEVVTTP